MVHQIGGDAMKLETSSSGLVGTLRVPGDKSISHRSIMFGSLATGTTTIDNFLRADDCLATVSIFKLLGVSIVDDGATIRIEGKGFNGLTSPQQTLNVGNSGTTIRLLMGILAGQPFDVELTGDASIKQRPMNRVMLPLQKMGAEIRGHQFTEYPPIMITGRQTLMPIIYPIPVASAQVKSALLFAAMQANGTTVLIEKEKTRDHTEKMIEQFGGSIKIEGKKLTISGNQSFTGQHVIVPGDISSAAFFIVAGLLVPNSHIVLKNVGLSETRTGIIDVVKKMGGRIQVIDVDELNESGTIEVWSSELSGTIIEGDIIPRLIDEIPIIALLATQASGQTIIRDAEELKVKETDRIQAISNELNQLGATIVPTKDGMIIKGTTTLHGNTVSSHGDHRIGMMLQIAALLVKDGEVILKGSEAVSVSYPTFFQDIQELMKGTK